MRASRVVVFFCVLLLVFRAGPARAVCFLSYSTLPFFHETKNTQKEIKNKKQFFHIAKISKRSGN